jgi:hypothetical protein
MTPKEKAEELVNKFNEYTVKAIKYYANGKIKECKEDAKECALIAVEYLWEESEYADSYYQRGFYWQEVKKEIEKL